MKCTTFPVLERIQFLQVLCTNFISLTRRWPLSERRVQRWQSQKCTTKFCKLGVKMSTVFVKIRGEVSQPFATNMDWYKLEKIQSGKKTLPIFLQVQMQWRIRIELGMTSTPCKFLIDVPECNGQSQWKSMYCFDTFVDFFVPGLLLPSFRECYSSWKDICWPVRRSKCTTLWSSSLKIANRAVPKTSFLLAMHETKHKCSRHCLSSYFAHFWSMWSFFLKLYCNFNSYSRYWIFQR